MHRASVWSGPLPLLAAMEQDLPDSAIYVIIRRINRIWVQKVGETATQGGLRACLERRYKPPLEELLTKSEQASFYLAWMEAPPDVAERRNWERLLTERLQPLGLRGFSRRVDPADRERLRSTVDQLESGLRDLLAGLQGS